MSPSTWTAPFLHRSPPPLFAIFYKWTYRSSRSQSGPARSCLILFRVMRRILHAWTKFVRHTWPSWEKTAFEAETQLVPLVRASMKITWKIIVMAFHFRSRWMNGDITIKIVYNMHVSFLTVCSFLRPNFIETISVLRSNYVASSWHSAGRHYFT